MTPTLIARLANDMRLIRFLVVGASGLIVNNLALIFFTELIGFHYLLSAAIATQFSTVWNFGLTESWVFGDRETTTSLRRRLFQFLLMNNFALAFRGPMLSGLVAWAGWHYVAANLASLLGIALLRYGLSNRWIWTAPLDEVQAEPCAYDIHGIIGIESMIRLPELEYFRVPVLKKSPDIHLRQERRRKPRRADRAIRYQDGLGRYGFEISIALGECHEVQVSALIMKSPHVLYTNVFEPLLRWTFARKGFALVHAACVAERGQATLITAQTDTGKTSTILQLIKRHPYAFISDDMTILGRDGRLLSFPKPLTISAHTLQAIGAARFSLKERLALQVQSRVHSRTGRQFAQWLSRSGLPAASINALVQILIPPPKHSIDRLVPEVKIRDRASLASVVLIERGPPLLEEMDHATIVEELARNAEDAYGFPPYPALAGDLSRWQGKDLHGVEREIIREALNARPALRLRSLSFDWWRRWPETLDALGKSRPILPSAWCIAIAPPDPRPNEWDGRPA